MIPISPALEAGGLTALSTAMVLTGEAANLGTWIYSIVRDPDSATMVVMGWLFGIKSLLRNGINFNKGRERTETMSSKGVTKMGAQYARKDRQAKDIMSPCMA
jgi:hypothetical protein